MELRYVARKKLLQILSVNSILDFARKNDLIKNSEATACATYELGIGVLPTQPDSGETTLSVHGVRRQTSEKPPFQPAFRDLHAFLKLER